MKYIVLILLMTACVMKGSSIQSDSATFFKREFYVKKINQHGEECNYQPVIIGFKADSICFWIDKSYCFTGAKQEDAAYGEQIISVRSTLHNERHYIRYIHKNGTIIFITNIDGGYPHFIFSTSDICYQLEDK